MSEIIKHFRDQYKNPDLYPRDNRELEEAFAGESHDASEHHSQKTEADFEVHGTVGKNYKQVVDAIFGYQEPGLSQKEQAVLEKRKDTVLSLLRRVLDDIDNYILQINNLKRVAESRDSENINSFQSEVGSSDNARRHAHDKLIADLKMSVRLINIFFNADFPSEARVAAEQGYADRAGMTAAAIAEINSQKKFLKFGRDGILIDFSKMPKDPLGEREYIAKWAFSVYQDLAALEHDINCQ